MANFQLISCVRGGMFVISVSLYFRFHYFYLYLAANFVRMVTTNESLAPRVNGAIGKVNSSANYFNWVDEETEVN